MDKVILKYDCDLIDELGEYLLSLKGINNVIIDNKEGTVNVLYDLDNISLNIISKEIEIYLGINGVPSLIGFDKCYNDKLSEYKMIIKDLCCEYCLKGYIEELLLIDGISKVTTDFDYINKDNVRINILYDDNVISVKDIMELEKKFNYE